VCTEMPDVLAGPLIHKAYLCQGQGTLTRMPAAVQYSAVQWRCSSLSSWYVFTVHFRAPFLLLPQVGPHASASLASRRRHTSSKRKVAWKALENVHTFLLLHIETLSKITNQSQTLSIAGMAPKPRALEYRTRLLGVQYHFSAY
jgi:hypothetical protein